MNVVDCFLSSYGVSNHCRFVNRTCFIYWAIGSASCLRNDWSGLSLCSTCLLPSWWWIGYVGGFYNENDQSSFWNTFWISHYIGWRSVFTDTNKEGTTVRKTYWTFYFLLSVLVILPISNLMIGTPFTYLDQLFATFTGKESSSSALIAREFRVPRLLVSLLAGACLSVPDYIL